MPLGGALLQMLQCLTASSPNSDQTRWLAAAAPPAAACHCHMRAQVRPAAAALQGLLLLLLLLQLSLLLVMLLPVLPVVCSLPPKVMRSCGVCLQTCKHARKESTNNERHTHLVICTECGNQYCAGSCRVNHDARRLGLDRWLDDPALGFDCTLSRLPVFTGAVVI